MISGFNLLLVDVRDDSERTGGEIASSVRMSCTHLQDPAVARCAAEWHRGRTVVIYCTRSLSRAPAAAQHLIRCLEAGVTSGGGPLPRDTAGRIERLAVLEGGICSYLQHVIQRLADRRYGTVNGFPDSAGGVPDVSTFIADFDPEMWLLASSVGAGCGEDVAHISEHPAVQEERRAARALADDGETSDELAFLVGQRCSLSPPAASSMPYIS